MEYIEDTNTSHPTFVNYDPHMSSQKYIAEIPGIPTAAILSHGVISNGRLLFLSGQGPYDPQTQTFKLGSLAEQTELTLKRLQFLAEAAGGKLENAVSVRCYLQQLTEKNFATMNEVYAKFFPEGRRPARTTIGAQLNNISIEIDAVIALD